MPFTSTEYLVFLFLVAAAFPFLPRRGRVAGMLLASYLFYLGQTPLHLGLLVGSTLLDFVVGLQLDREGSPRTRRAWLLVSLTGNLGALVAFKYTGMFAEVWNWFGSDAAGGLVIPKWVLPLGISFYTFQTIGYTLDVYRRRIPACRSVLDYALYVSFFPQLVAGPIERAEHLLPQLRALQPVGLANLSLGLRRILWGLLKKLAIADRLRPEVFDVLDAPAAHDTLSLVVTCFGLLAILYLDFSAYTDIARGSARLFGVELVENFHTPFAATSISDFTRRWHVSLIRWIEDYLYAPLMRGRVTHTKIWSTNLLVISLFGVWHGPYVSFLLAGGALGVAISIEQSGRLRRAHRGERGVRRTPLRALGGWATAVSIWAFFVVVLFTADTEHALDFYAALGSPSWPDPAHSTYLTRTALILCALLGVHIVGARLDLERHWQRLPRPVRPALLFFVAWFLVRSMPATIESFVYFRF